MAYFRDNIEAMTGYLPGEQPQGGDFIKLNTNENPYPPSPRVIEAIRAAADEAMRKYPDPAANVDRDMVAELFDLKRENVVCGNGSDDILSMAFRAVIGPGDSVTMTDPTYSLYETLAQIQDARLDVIECNDDFSLPIEALCRSKSPLVVVANPNAPTGLLAPTDEIARIARSINGILLVDEAYVDFADDNAMSLAHTEPNVLVMRTLSKSYSLAGLRFGYAAGSAALVAGLMKVKDSYNCDALSIAAARAALADQQWMRQNVEKVRNERTRLIRELRNLAFAVLDSQSNFVLAAPPDGDAEGLYLKLKERGILVRYFKSPRVARCVRITVGTPDEVTALLGELKALCYSAK